ncbi:MAG: helix-turn-helix domain-containing protein [Alkaliphilus sp.]|nr:helix-turn-helix domain-containing protein [Alkaliphilus sp.]
MSQELSMNPELFGANLRFFRTLSRLSQEELAKKSGVAVHIISRIERGAMKRIPLNVAYPITQVFNCTIEDFFLERDVQKMRMKGGV